MSLSKSLSSYRSVAEGSKGRRLLIHSCLVAVFSGAAFALVACAGFIAAPTYLVGISPASVAIADFNGDGIPDLAVANLNNVVGIKGTVSILLGNGDGTFQAAQDYTVGTQARSVVVGDFNGDGHLDLAVSNSNAADQPVVSILLGNGDGTFQAAQDFATPNGGTSLVVGDFNGDGILDLATVGTAVTILLGNGDGTFQTGQTYAAGDNPISLAVADFNGDGWLDLAVADPGSFNSGSVRVLLGNGDGTFQAAQRYAVGGNPWSVAAADLNRDGAPDLVVANEGSHSVNILLGNGDGTFRAGHSYPTADGPRSVAVADVNGDGHPDLVVILIFGPVMILFGNGDGTFQAAHSYAANNGPGSVAVGDFNRDGIPDLAVANSSSDFDRGTVSVLLGKGDGTFRAAPSYPAGYAPWAVTVGDFNGDGIPDLAVADSYGSNVVLTGSLSILLGNGDGTFRPGNTIAAGAGNNFIAVADLNGDGKLDIVMTSFDEGNPPKDGRPPVSELRVFLGNGDGTFQRAIVYKTELGPGSVAVGDFNGDGIPDIAVANFGGFAAPGSTVSILLGNGDGTFQAAQNYTVGLGPLSVAVGEFNGDGIPDLVVASFYSDTVSVLLGNGDGTFQAARNYTVGVVGPLAVGDFNGDGILDLAVPGGINPNKVSILLGNGDGTFQRPMDSTVGFAPWSLSVGDFNRDGVLDLAVTHFQAGMVSVLLGKGDGSFQAVGSYRVGVYPRSSAVADFNGDGFPDIALANENSSTVTIFINAADWPP